MSPPLERPLILVAPRYCRPKLVCTRGRAFTNSPESACLSPVRRGAPRVHHAAGLHARTPPRKPPTNARRRETPIENSRFSGADCEPNRIAGTSEKDDFERSMVSCNYSLQKHYPLEYEIYFFTNEKKQHLYFDAYFAKVYCNKRMLRISLMFSGRSFQHIGEQVSWTMDRTVQI